MVISLPVRVQAMCGQPPVPLNPYSQRFDRDYHNSTWAERSFPLDRVIAWWAERHRSGVALQLRGYEHPIWLDLTVDEFEDRYAAAAQTKVQPPKPTIATLAEDVRITGNEERLLWQRWGGFVSTDGTLWGFVGKGDGLRIEEALTPGTVYARPGAPGADRPSFTVATLLALARAWNLPHVAPK